MEKNKTPEQELQQDIEYALANFVNQENLVNYLLQTAKTYHYSKLIIEIEEKWKQILK